jgi:hypothetical protein
MDSKCLMDRPQNGTKAIRIQAHWSLDVMLGELAEVHVHAKMSGFLFFLGGCAERGHQSGGRIG